MNKASKIISGIVILLIIAGGAFYGGMIYGKGQSTASTASARAGFGGMRGARMGANGAGFTSGTIIAEDSSSITLQLPNNGGSKIIFYSSSTQIAKTTSGAPSDLTNGTTVSVTGTTNSDGSVTAQSIQIRPSVQNPAQQPAQ